MTRIVSIGLAAAAGLVLSLAAAPSSAQTPYHPYGWRAPAAYGQQAYGYSYGYAAAGTPLSEVQTRAYVRTGDYADGYGHVYPERHGYGYSYGGYAPTHGYVSSYGYDPRYRQQGWREDRGGRYGYSERRYSERGYSSGGAGYRDWYGYNDDRPLSARRGEWREDRHERDCGCREHRPYADGYVYGSYDAY